MEFLKIAYRNLFRNRRRTVITGSVIVFGSMALILAGGFMQFLFQGLRENTIRNGVGHLQVFQSLYLEQDEEKPLQYGMESYQEVITAIEAVPQVRQATARLDFTGLLSNGDKSVVFLGTGVTPGLEQRMGYTLSIREGQDLRDSAPGEAEAALAVGLARLLKARVGDRLTLLTTTTEGALNGLDVQVVGTFTTGIAELDERALRVPLAAAQALLDTTRVSKLVVSLDTTASTDAAFVDLQRLFQQKSWPLKMKKWLDLATFYRQVVTLFTAVFAFLGVIIFVLVVLSSSNTMMMAVMERVREIGTLMAFGTTRRQVLSIFVLEAVLMGLLGGLLGAGASYLAIHAINAAQIPMPAPPGSTRGFPIAVLTLPSLFAATWVLMVITMSLAAVVPALKASRLRIVDALNQS